MYCLSALPPAQVPTREGFVLRGTPSFGAHEGDATVERLARRSSLMHVVCLVQIVIGAFVVADVISGLLTGRSILPLPLGAPPSPPREALVSRRCVVLCLVREAARERPKGGTEHQQLESSTSSTATTVCVRRAQGVCCQHTCA